MYGCNKGIEEIFLFLSHIGNGHYHGARYHFSLSVTGINVVPVANIMLSVTGINVMPLLMCIIGNNDGLLVMLYR